MRDRRRRVPWRHPSPKEVSPCLALSKPCRRIPPRSVASERWAGTFCYTLGYYRDMERSSLFGRPVIRVSRVGSSQAQLVFDLTLKAFGEYRDVLDPPTGVLFETVADVQKSIDAEAAAIAWIGDRAVGAVRWEARPGYLYAGRLAVLPEARGAGVGAALMAFVEDRARMLGLSEVQVGVRSALPGNIAFFHRLGYTQIRIDPHPRNSMATSVTLAKEIVDRGPADSNKG